MEFNDERFERFLRWKVTLKWVVFAFVAGAIIVGIAISFGRRVGAGD